MEASSDRPRVRPMVVDFLATLFYTFCIGVAAAITLGACVVLLAGKAHGSEIVTPEAGDTRHETPLPDAPIFELALVHHLVAKHTTLIAVERAPTAHRRAGAPSLLGSLTANRGAPASLVRAE